MTITGLLVTLVLVGVVLLDATIKQILNVVVVILVVLWLLSVFGALPFLNAPLPRLR